MRSLLADDEPKVCSALRLWLAEAPGREIGGEVGDVWALFNCLATSKPAVLLLDARLTDWPQVLAAIHWRCPSVGIIGFSSALKLVPSLALTGVKAWVSKWEPPDQLLQVLKQLQPAP